LKTITQFKHQYTETEDCWIPMPDGIKIAAKLWLPDIAATQRVPTIIEVIPYRKRDIYARCAAPPLFRRSRLRDHARGHPRFG